jgi:hypothetical protein
MYANKMIKIGDLYLPCIALAHSPQVYIMNVSNNFHNFRRLVKYATMKIESMIENGWSLKLHQTQQVDALIY